MFDTKNIIIIVVGVLLAVIIYCLGTRYQMVATSERDSSHVYMYDRLTGNSWKTLGTVPDYIFPVLSISEEKLKETIKERPQKKKFNPDDYVPVSPKR